jgi:hypothetical protein
MNAPANRNETRALTTGADQPRYDVQTLAPSGRDLILRSDNLNALLKVAQLMSLSKNAVPKHLRGNEGACLAVTMQAMRWNMDPFAVASKTYQVDVDAQIAYEGQAIIAALNNSPLLATRLAFEWAGQWERIVGRFKQVESKTKKDGDGNFKKYIVPDWDFNKDEEGLSCTVSALLVGESAPRTLTLLMKQARTRNSPLWTEDPKQQLAYLTARRWGRLHTPDVIMGVYTPDELMEFDPPKHMGEADVVTTVPPELVESAKKAAAGGLAAYQTFWRNTTMMEKALLSESSAIHEECKIAAAEADKKRTVDTPNKPAATPAPTTGPTAASQADPATGETTAPKTTVDRTEGQEFVANFATVLDLLVKGKAQGRIAVEVASEWIPEVQNAEHRAELERKRDEILAELDGAQAK